MHIHRSLTALACIAIMLVLGGASCISFGADTQEETSGPAGMFVSLDRGDNWQQISSLPTADGNKSLASVSVFKLTEDPQDPAALYWSSRNRGLFFSINNGQSWQRSPKPLDTGFIYSIAVHPESKCTLYATNGRFIYKSIDCSRSWEEVYRETTSGGLIRSLAISRFEDHRIFMGKDNGEILESNDDGQSWQVIHRGKKGLRDIVVDPFQEGLVYTTHIRNGLQRSRDNGRSWTDLSEKFDEFSGAKNFRSLVLHPFKLENIFWISDYGILLSEDSGNSWQPLDLLTSPGSVKIYSFAVNPKNDKEMYYTATVQTRSTLYKTADGGKTWTTKRLPSGQIPTEMRVHPKQENVLYLGFTIPPSS